MKKNGAVIEVIFRNYSDGEVVALFPYQVECRYCSCLSYMHVGQHGTANLSLIKDTKLAVPDEYRALYNELTTQVGYQLKVIKKMNWKRYNKAYYENQEMCK